MPGISPIMASKPKRMLVPGTRNAVQSSVASASIRAIRAARDCAGEVSKRVKPYCALLMRRHMGAVGRNASGVLADLRLCHLTLADIVARARYKQCGGFRTGTTATPRVARAAAHRAVPACHQA